MIEDLVKQIEARFAELGAQMTDPDVISDRERYAEVGFVCFALAVGSIDRDSSNPLSARITPDEQRRL